MPIDTSQAGYVALRDMFAERTRQFVAWTGAGASASAGLPTWFGLRQLLVEALRSKSKGSTIPDEQKRMSAIAEHALNQPDLWLAFGMLQDALGKTTFRTSITNSLRIAETCPPPRIYERIWELGFSAVLNFNLDRLATRAFQKVRGAQKLNEAIGHQAGSVLHLLQSTHPFVLNLHGTAENYGSWVFTPAERDRLLGNEGYTHFLKTVLSSRVVLFLGISADDLSIVTHFEKLRAIGVDFDRHFWITDRGDPSLDRKAEELGIQLIYYRNASKRHQEVHDFFDDLQKYVPVEQQAPPVRPLLIAKPGIPDQLPPPAELKNQDAEVIREKLNARAASILGSERSDKYREFSEFTTRYSEAIYRSWYVGTTEPDNELLGYRLIDKVGEGAFGRVFEATTISHEHVAVKLLHYELLRNNEMLQSFRRGVQSMKILGESSIQNVVRFKEASEIPAFVVMEFVNGPDLKTAIEAGHIDTWDERLKICLTLASTIRLAHEHPQRVLHRDIRPTNIMLRNYYEETNALPDVVVLDFDLSWHRDATEKSILRPASASGYLAPEQLNRDPKVTTRSAYVDSFGLGMTMFFIGTGRDPKVGEAQSANWESTVMNSIADPPEAWRSLARRFGRLILSCTKPNQRERFDLGQIVGELTLLLGVVQEPTKARSAELVAEEVLFRATGGDRYQWDTDTARGQWHLVSGASFTIEANEAENTILAKVAWTSTGDRDRKQIGKWVNRAADQVVSEMKKGGWTKIEASVSHDAMFLSFTIPVAATNTRLESISKSVSSSLDLLRFS